MSENDDFIRQRQRAVERMMEMSAQASAAAGSEHIMPPAPPFIRMQSGVNNASQKHAEAETKSPSESKDLSVKPQTRAEKGFLERLSTESDLPLVLGLLLLLWSEKADRRLMLALAYILI